MYERVLTPNVGHEAAPYLAHILEFDHNPQELMLFAHHHGPNAWHASPSLSSGEHVRIMVV